VPTATAPSEAPAPAAPRGPDPLAVAGDLERALGKQRLWSTVSVVGARIEIRSSSCADPAMPSIVNATTDKLKAAGLTKLRCVEQSGRLVNERDL
jgi:hypothetical protein